ncbi:MAG: hypothetical protein WBB01_23985 [Phormidesmis sp.]
MNRYDSTAQTPSEPIPQDQISLSIVRPGLSRFSRTVRADFKVRSTAQVIEVQFLQHRIREQLVATSPENEPTGNISLYVLFVLATIVFVGGTVVSTGSIVAGIIVAALLPVGYMLIAPPKSNKLYCRKAILKLVHTPDGHLLLTLMTAPKTKPALSSLPTTLHISQVPIHAIQSGPVILLSEANPFCHQVSFTLAGTQSHRPNQIRITGSRQEIRWLCRHLEWWGHVSANRRGRSQNTP